MSDTRRHLEEGVGQMMARLDQLAADYAAADTEAGRVACLAELEMNKPGSKAAIRRAVDARNAANALRDEMDRTRAALRHARNEIVRIDEQAELRRQHDEDAAALALYAALPEAFARLDAAIAALEPAAAAAFDAFESARNAIAASPRLRTLVPHLDLTRVMAPGHRSVTALAGGRLGRALGLTPPVWMERPPTTMAAMFPAAEAVLGRTQPVEWRGGIPAGPRTAPTPEEMEAAE